MSESKNCIVTGGAGFIGCAISHALAEQFDRVIVIDVLHPQIHPEKQRPALLDKRVELVIGDVCDPLVWDTVFSSLTQVHTVIDLAAETGTAQSLSEASRHAQTNVVGTTQMLDACVRNNKMPQEILLTSSRAVYGEGAWQRKDGTVYYPGQRSDAQLAQKIWNFPDAHYIPFSASETQPNPTSIYGSTKLAQEHILRAWCKSFGVQFKCVRLQNVYGPGQSLINPYTGIVSLFVRLAKKGESIPLYEDGEIIRDFILIDDVADALISLLAFSQQDDAVFDIGTGTESTIAQVAHIIAQRYNAPAPHVCERYRNGDVRHASCKIHAAQQAFGYTPKYTLEQGLHRLCDWIDTQI